MDTAILSATAALVGSMVGGASTFLASWWTHQAQLRARAATQEIARREALYAEFIVEASNRLADAWSHEAETPAVVAQLYSAVERMRLVSSARVIDAAHHVVREVVEAYAAPNRSFDDARQRISELKDMSPLKEFADLCRLELNQLAARPPMIRRAQSHSRRSSVLDWNQSPGVTESWSARPLWRDSDLAKHVSDRPPSASASHTAAEIG